MCRRAWRRCASGGGRTTDHRGLVAALASGWRWLRGASLLIAGCARHTWSGRRFFSESRRLSQRHPPFGLRLSKYFRKLLPGSCHCAVQRRCRPDRAVGLAWQWHFFELNRCFAQAWRAQAAIESVVVLVALEAGMCARRRTYFLLRRQKKVGKEKATPLAVSLRFAAGSLRCSCAGRRCGTRCALAALRSDSRSESEHEAWSCCAAHARPTPCASRHGQRGWGDTGHRFARPRSSQQAARLVLAPPKGRGAGHARDRRGRGPPGHWRCPLEGGGETSRSEWSLGVGLFHPLVELNDRQHHRQHDQHHHNAHGHDQQRLQDGGQLQGATLHFGAGLMGGALQH